MIGNNTELRDGIDLDVLTNVMTAFRQLMPDEREMLLQMIATNFKLKIPGVRTSTPVQERIVSSLGEEATAGSFSEDRSMSPKEFIMQKQPRTDLERVACLAYYLTHYKATPHFKTLDISKMNTEAAQPKFSNAAKAVDNATRNDYLAYATKGNKQLSATGEQFVQALPDRDAAKALMSKLRKRRKVRKVVQQNQTHTK